MKFFIENDYNYFFIHSFIYFNLRKMNAIANSMTEQEVIVSSSIEQLLKTIKNIHLT